MKLPSEVKAVEQRLQWCFDDGADPVLDVEVKRLPGKDPVTRTAAEFWPGVWATEDGRYFVVTDREVLWFDTRDDMLTTMSALLRR